MLLHVAFINPSRQTTLFNCLAYGLTENTGVQITLPLILSSKLPNLMGSGLGNIRLLGQWHFYKKSSNISVFTAGVRIPTRTIKTINLNPLAVASYIFDVVSIHFSDNWYVLARGVMNVTPENRNLKPGNTYFYTLSTGPKIIIRKTSLELRGTHISDSSLQGITFPSGGNILFLSSHFGLKRNNITADMAFGWPILQRIDPSVQRFEWFCAFALQIDF